MRISDWSSDVCSSDLCAYFSDSAKSTRTETCDSLTPGLKGGAADCGAAWFAAARSEEHTSELQSLMRISYAVFCLKKKKTNHKLRLVKSKHTNKKTQRNESHHHTT